MGWPYTRSNLVLVNLFLSLFLWLGLVKNQMFLSVPSPPGGLCWRLKALGLGPAESRWQRLMRRWCKSENVNKIG